MAGTPPVMWFWRRHLNDARASGLSVEQFRVLCVLERNDAASLTDLATMLGASLPSASRLVGRLVERGFLSRDESGDDRRRRELVMTESGREALLAGRAVIRDALATELSASLSDEQCERITGAMRTLDEVFSAARSKPAATPGSAAE